MKDITILHISDLHIESKRQGDIQIVLNAFLQDIDKLKNEQNVTIDFVCFTGDLIKQGDLAVEQFQLAQDKLIIPLLEKLGLDHSHFFIIPGNHEVDRKLIDKFTDTGLQQLLISRDSVNQFLDSELQPQHISRLSAFYQFRDEKFGAGGKSHGLCVTHVREHGPAKIGFACLDSAWRCAGSADKGHLIVGERQVDNAYLAINHCDLKIALIHHPLSWLADHDQKAVRDLLWKFDLVLTGHEHDLSEYEMIIDGQTTMYCACGALYDGRETYNGYSIIRINPLTKSGDILLRQYYDSPRRVFDAALRLSENGKRTFALHRGNSSVDKVRRYTACLAECMSSFASESLLTRMVDESGPSGLEDVYVAPKLRKTSEYVKEKMRDDGESFSLEHVLNQDNNVMFVGKREIGKTTMLQYIALKQVQNYSTGASAPFIVDLSRLPVGKRPIEKLMAEFVHEASNNTFHFSNQDIEALLSDGLCLLLFDNIEAGQNDHINTIKEFVKQYPKNRFILVINESIFNALEVKDLPEFGCEVSTWYMQTLDRHMVRTLITKWFNGHNISVEDMVERTMAYLNRVMLPRTPLIVSMFLAIYKRDKDYVPVNESSIMERFMEMVLEKLSPDDTRVGAFDYRSKEKFLSELAWHMIKEKKYPITLDDFNKFTLTYFESRGLSLSRSKFDRLFFEKRVLVQNNGMVFFRYRSMLEYHVAVKAIKDTDALKHVLSTDRIFDSTGIIGFITGLERGRHDILVEVESLLYPILRSGLESLSALENYDVGLDIEVDIKSLSDDLKESVLTETERDEVLNVPDKYHNFETQTVSVDPYNITTFDKLFILTSIYGRLLRNSEDFDKETKMKAFRVFCLALCIVWAELKKIIDSSIERDLADDIEGEASDMISLIKIALPMAIQNMASETIGTPMLDTVIQESIPMNNNNFIDFMVVCLYLDLKMKDSASVINAYVQREDSKDLLRILMFKLMYVYHTGLYEGSQARALLESLANGILKLNGLKNQHRKRLIHALEHGTDKNLSLKQFLS